MGLKTAFVDCQLQFAQLLIIYYK